MNLHLAEMILHNGCSALNKQSQRLLEEAKWNCLKHTHTHRGTTAEDNLVIPGGGKTRKSLFYHLFKALLDYQERLRVQS